MSTYPYMLATQSKTYGNGTALPGADVDLQSVRPGLAESQGGDTSGSKDLVKTFATFIDVWDVGNLGLIYENGTSDKLPITAIPWRIPAARIRYIDVSETSCTKLTIYW